MAKEDKSQARLFTQKFKMPEKPQGEIKLVRRNENIVDPTTLPNAEAIQQGINQLTPHINLLLAVSEGLDSIRNDQIEINRLTTIADQKIAPPSDLIALRNLQDCMQLMKNTLNERSEDYTAARELLDLLSGLLPDDVRVSIFPISSFTSCLRNN